MIRLVHIQSSCGSGFYSPRLHLPTDFFLVGLYCLVVVVASVGRHALPEIWRLADRAPPGSHGPGLSLAGAVFSTSLSLLGLAIIGLPLFFRRRATSRLMNVLRTTRPIVRADDSTQLQSHARRLHRWALRAHARAIARAGSGGFDARFFTGKLRRASSPKCCVSFLPRFIEALLMVGDSSSVLMSERDALGRYGAREAFWEVHVVNLLFGGFLVCAGVMGSQFPRNRIDVVVVECTIAIVLGSVFIWRWLQAARLTPFDWNDVIAGPGEVTIVGPLRSREFRAADATAILYAASLNRIFIRVVEVTGRHASFSLDFEATRRFVALWTQDIETPLPSVSPPDSSHCCQSLRGRAAPQT